MSNRSIGGHLDPSPHQPLQGSVRNFQISPRHCQRYEPIFSSPSRDRKKSPNERGNSAVCKSPYRTPRNCLTNDRIIDNEACTIVEEVPLVAGTYSSRMREKQSTAGSTSTTTTTSASIKTTKSVTTTNQVTTSSSSSSGLGGGGGGGGDDEHDFEPRNHNLESRTNAGGSGTTTHRSSSYRSVETSDEQENHRPLSQKYNQKSSSTAAGKTSRGYRRSQQRNDSHSSEESNSRRQSDAVASEGPPASRPTRTERDPTRTNRSADAGATEIDGEDERTQLGTNCCFCWSVRGICGLNVKPNLEDTSRPTPSNDGQTRTETSSSDDKVTLDDVKKWAESFDCLMQSIAGQKAFRNFLKMEYSEENIMFWLACEELKKEKNPELAEEKARIIYEDFISILSPKEVSLDSRVRDMINANMIEPHQHTFDEAQLQIYTLMHRDSYPRFLNSKAYKELLHRASTANSPVAIT